MARGAEKFKAFSIQSNIKCVLHGSLPVIVIMHPWHPSAGYRITFLWNQSGLTGSIWALPSGLCKHIMPRNMFSEVIQLSSIKSIWIKFVFLLETLGGGIPEVCDPPLAARSSCLFNLVPLILPSKMKNRKEAVLRSKVILWSVLSDTYQRWKHGSS